MIGKDRHLRRLRRLSGAEVTREANKIVYVGADMIRTKAHQSISAGSVSGKGHVPSAPGEPPNRDTGNLQAHLTTSQPKPLVAEVRSEAEYATALEFGTSDMAARPHMRPARESEEPKIQRLFATAMGDLVKRSGR